MTEKDTNDTNCVSRDQVVTALRFLEWSHGDALRRPWSDEAHAYYEAIDILEAALDGDLRPPNELPWLEGEDQLIEQSRNARNEGYEAATLIDESYGNKEIRSPDVHERVSDIVNSLLNRLD